MSSQQFCTVCPKTYHMKGHSPHVVIIFGILFRDCMKILRVDAGDDMLCVNFVTFIFELPK